MGRAEAGVEERTESKSPGVPDRDAALRTVAASVAALEARMDAMAAGDRLQDAVSPESGGPASAEETAPEAAALRESIARLGRKTVRIFEAAKRGEAP